jgi:hypothetical protein
MKRLYSIFVVLILTAHFVAAQVTTERCFHLDKVQFIQQKQDFWRGHVLYSTSERPLEALGGGFYNLTELQYGFGLGLVDVPYSNHYLGITTVNGYHFSGGLALGVGVGYQQYNDGYGIPLYGDIRYFMGKQRVKFFLAIPGGFILNIENFKDYSRIFANPSIGLIVPLAKNLHLSFSSGLLTQFDRGYFTHEGDGYRDSFINMRLGLLFGK